MCRPAPWCPAVQAGFNALLRNHVVSIYMLAELLLLCSAVKIGRPGYKVTKQYDQNTHARSLLFQVRRHGMLRSCHASRCRC